MGGTITCGMVNFEMVDMENCVGCEHRYPPEALSTLWCRFKSIKYRTEFNDKINNQFVKEMRNNLALLSQKSLHR